MKWIFLSAAVSAVATATEAFGAFSSRFVAVSKPPQFSNHCLARRHPFFIDRRDARDVRFERSDFDPKPLSSSKEDEAQDAEIVTGEGKGSTLMERIDNVGSKLKPMAVEAKERSAAATTDDRPMMRILYTMKACSLFALFGFYRAYRGFFILLPAVFRQVYAKMEIAVQAPFVDDDDLDENSRDVDPSTGRVRFRTRFTVSVLSAIVTASYVVMGLWKVFMMFLKTVARTSSMKDSFEAAADEVLSNEEKIKRMTDKNKVNGED